MGERLRRFVQMHDDKMEPHNDGDWVEYDQAQTYVKRAEDNERDAEHWRIFKTHMHLIQVTRVNADGSTRSYTKVNCPSVAGDHWSPDTIADALRETANAK